MLSQSERHENAKYRLWSPCPSTKPESSSPDSSSTSAERSSSMASSRCSANCPSSLLLMASCRRVGAARTVGRRAAPDTLVAARAVPVQPIRTIRATMSVAGRTAPFAMLLVVPVFMKPTRAVCASVPVACRTAMSAFCRHLNFPFARYYTKLLRPAPYPRQFQSAIGNRQHWNWQHSHIGNTPSPTRWGERTRLRALRVAFGNVPSEASPLRCMSSASRRLVFTSPMTSPLALLFQCCCVKSCCPC